MIHCAQQTTIFTKKAPPIPTRFRRDMLRLVLKDTSFQFNGKHNLQMQIHGTAMGTKTALSFANIYMAKIETESLSKLQHGNATYTTCFPCGTIINQTLRLSLSKPNSHHPTIKLTAKISDTEAVFLDTVI